MLKSVSNWLESVGMVERPSSPTEDEKVAVSEYDETALPKAEFQVQEKDDKATRSSDVENTKEESNEDTLDIAMKTLDDVGEKAVNTAKEWGSYIYSFGKVAGQTVYSTAKDTAVLIKDSMTEKSLFSEFNKEQSKFIAGKKEKQRNTEASIAPWIGYHEEKEMKDQILALSKDKRNFLRNPPSGIQFQFDFTSVYPVAMATLQEDPNLNTMRFELVPQYISEEKFWRNYFYRVSLIKQSTQLSSMTHDTGNDKLNDSSVTSSSENPNKTQPLPVSDNHPEVDMLPESPADHEFVSDGYSDPDLTEDDLRRGMRDLGVQEVDKRKPQPKNEEDSPQWEQELQRELADFELVNDGTGNEFDDEDIENEILQQIEHETSRR